MFPVSTHNQYIYINIFFKRSINSANDDTSAKHYAADKYILCSRKTERERTYLLNAKRDLTTPNNLDVTVHAHCPYIYIYIHILQHNGECLVCDVTTICTMSSMRVNEPNRQSRNLKQQQQQIAVA